MYKSDKLGKILNSLLEVSTAAWGASALTYLLNLTDIKLWEYTGYAMASIGAANLVYGYLKYKGYI